MTNLLELWQKYHRSFITPFLQQKGANFEWVSEDMCRIYGTRDTYTINVLTGEVLLQQRNTELKWFWLESPSWIRIPVPSLSLPDEFPDEYRNSTLELKGIPAKVFAILEELTDDTQIDNLHIATQLMPKVETSIPVPSSSTPESSRGTVSSSQPEVYEPLIPEQPAEPLTTPDFIDKLSETDYELAPQKIISTSLSRKEIIQLLSAYISILSITINVEIEGKERDKGTLDSGISYCNRLIDNMKQRPEDGQLNPDELQTLRLLLDVLTSIEL